MMSASALSSVGVRGAPLRAGSGSKRGASSSSRRSGATRHVTSAAVAAPPGKVLYDTTVKAPGGTCTMVRVDSPDGTRTITFKATGMGGNLELHWGVVVEGGEGWGPPPDGSDLPGGSKPFGDGIATRSPFSGDTLTMSFPKGVGEDIERVVGIIVSGSEWLHAEGGDLAVPLRVATSGGLVKRLANAEKPNKEPFKGGNLFERFCRINEALDEATQSGPAGAAAIQAVLRLSAIRQLPWYAGGNYQGKDMAHKQEVVARRIAVAAVTAEDGMSRQLFRASLATVPRGGGNGDDIRLGILQIMRENGIKEGHRPGIEDKFIGQWHQKLHSNTTPDDISICEAYLHFLHTGNWDDFWDHLYTNAKLTKEDLAGMKAGWRTDGISGPAQHLPQMINPMKHFLWILKTTHGGGNVYGAMQFARDALPGDLKEDVDGMLKNKDEWWVPGKIVNIRERLHSHTKNGDINRDVVMLDVNLEKFFRQKVEAMDTKSMSADELLTLLDLAATNCCVGGDFQRMNTAMGFFRRAQGTDAGERWSPQWAQVMDAALDSVALAMEYHMDSLCSLVQAPASAVGAMAQCDPAYIANFGEEVVRGHSMFAVSKVIGDVRSHVRTAAGRSAWLLISAGKPDLSVHAGVCVVQSLEELQGQDLSATPTVVLSERLGGLEDIPPGVTAVITSAPVDLLSHIAIRARNVGVMLAAMTDPAGWAALTAMAGSGVKLSVVGEEVMMETSALTSAGGATTAAVAERLQLTPSKNSEEWMVTQEMYAPGIVGGKSSSLAALGAKVSALGVTDLRVPSSLALPFGAFDRALAADAGTAAVYGAGIKALAAAEAAGDASERREALTLLREVVVDLEMPEELAPHLDAAAAALGGGVDVDGLYTAVKRVWASKWTERAYLSRKACQVPDAELHMAALLMELVPADLAFVLHTSNPLTGDKDEVFGEVCVGLGEALVGNEAGSALSFTMGKAPGAAFAVRSLPSKPIAHQPPNGATTVIVRSDSNGEDLEGFAGAGLYDSVTVSPTTSRVVNYAEEWLVWDAGRRAALIQRLTQLAVAVEREMGAPQDIEGCVVGDTVVLLQSRAQI